MHTVLALGLVLLAALTGQVVLLHHLNMIFWQKSTIERLIAVILAPRGSLPVCSPPSELLLLPRRSLAALLLQSDHSICDLQLRSPGSGHALPVVLSADLPVYMRPEQSFPVVPIVLRQLLREILHTHPSAASFPQCDTPSTVSRILPPILSEFLCCPSLPLHMLPSMLFDLQS
ncbi:hypothetical protein Aduo_019659 [Ancylostoma duodenale]